MAVISISITVSEDQIVEGIPKFITLTTNTPATIFYTLDSSVPTLFSTIYVGPILLPVNKPAVILQAFATNGVDTSSIITETYMTNIFQDSVRYPHANTTDTPGNITPNLYPFGDSSPQPNSDYTSTANSGTTVNDPALTQIPNAFDGAHNPNAFTNQPYNIENYEIQAFQTDAEGQIGPGIGDLPNIKVISQADAPDFSSQFTVSFDPRAKVIFQDLSKEDPNDPTQINSQFLNLEEQDRSWGGLNYYSSGLDAPTARGTFVRSHYNPTTNNMHYYYFDSFSNRWVISVQELKPSEAPQGMDFSGGFSNSNHRGSRFIYEWLPFKRQILF